MAIAKKKADKRSAAELLKDGKAIDTAVKRAVARAVREAGARRGAAGKAGL